jgi:16S rRNA (uracil1498-N3)-methyltransferase
MRTIRLYVDTPLQPGESLDLPSAPAEHAVRVLRLRTGDALTLFNGDGHDYPGEIVAADKRNARVKVLSCVAAAAESPLSVTLAQAMARGEKMDWIVQKATELGVTRIVPLQTERSELRLDARRAEKRLAHWRAVATAACEQSGRAVIPHIEAPGPLDSWLRTLVGNSLPQLALLPESGQRARELDLSAGGAVLAVGPEGGWGERDLAALREASFRSLQLGPRVLRTETAGIAALAALQSLHGDF